MDTRPLLRLQDTHRSAFLNHNDPIQDELRVHMHTIDKPDAAYDRLLHAAGFKHISKIGRFPIDPALITALVERWRPETHTFHLPCGECTITLEDVALILGIPINGSAVIGPSFFDLNEVCSDLLGIVPPKDQLKGSTIKMKWLHNTFKNLPTNASNVQVAHYCRAYILRLIGGILLPDKSSNRVHLMYLKLLENFKRAGKYSWGSACLATLYRELCRATRRGASSMGGCLWLLQSWAWYRLPFIAPRVTHEPTFPLIQRWTGNLNHTGTHHGNLAGYRIQLDYMHIHEFVWMPYETLKDILPSDISEEKDIWSTCTVLICFSIIEWHQTDRVRRQFGLMQHIPQDPINLDNVHTIDMRGQQYTDWKEYHQSWIPYWENRQQFILQGLRCEGQLLPSKEYMTWYINNSRPILSTNDDLQDPRNRPLPDITQHNVSSQEFDFSLPRQRQRRVACSRIRQSTPEVDESAMHQQSHDIPEASSSQFTSHDQTINYGISPQPATGDDFISNLFGVNMGTPASASAYMANLYSFGAPSNFHATPFASQAETPFASQAWTPFASQAGTPFASQAGTSTNKQLNQPTMLNLDETEDFDEQNPIIQLPRRNPRRHRQAPRCGTGGHRH